MAWIFPLISQLRNSTDQRVGFRVKVGDCPLRDIPPRKTRNIKLSKILRCCRTRESTDWTIDVLVNGRFTGMQLKPKDHVMFYARIVFKIDTNGVACIDGVLENNGSDFFFRHKLLGIGWMRNRAWDKREPAHIARADSNLARKLRGLEYPAPIQKLDRFANTASPKRPYYSSPQRKVHMNDNETEIIKKKSPETELKTAKLPAEKHFKEEQSAKGQSKFVTTTASPKGKKESTDTPLPISGLRSGTHVDNTAVDGGLSPDRMVKNGGGHREISSDHIGLQRPRLRDDHHNLDHDHRGSNMDSFVHVLLFIFAFAMVFFVALYK